MALYYLLYQVSAPPPDLWATLLPMFVFLFWFISAPESRFGFAFIWLTALLPWVPLLGRVTLIQNNRLLSGVPGALLLFLTAKMIYRENLLTVQTLVLPDWEGYRDQQAKGLGYRPHRTQSGLEVLMPEPVPLEQRCFDLEQPCSPYFFWDLEKRGATPESGFRRRSLRQPSTSTDSKRDSKIPRYYPHLQ